MIIRKPYALLIKNFKLIHGLLLMLMGYLLYSLFQINAFFSEYFEDSLSVRGQELTDSLFNGFIYLANFLVILGLITVLIVMFVKKKPIKYYLAAILTYVGSIIYFNISESIINQLELELLDAQLVRGVADFAVIIMILQVAIMLFTLVRATGFDIKAFDFDKDLDALDFTEEDREEVEVGLSFDPEKFRRNFKKRVRHMRYAYLENKLAWRVVFGVIVILFGIFMYDFLGFNEKIYKEGHEFYAGDFYFTVVESYIVDEDAAGNKLDDEKTLLLINLNINGRLNSNKLDEARLQLSINDTPYYPTVRFEQEVEDLGQLYNGDKISKGDNNYLIAYEIPSNYTEEEMKFQYIKELYGIEKQLQTTYEKVLLTPIDLRIEKDDINVESNYEIELTDSFLSETVIKVGAYEIKDEYKLSYIFCPVETECYTSYEYIKGNIFTNYTASLMKLNISVDFNDKYLNEDDINEFISTYGYIEYMLNDEWKQFNNIEIIVPENSTTEDEIYMSVPKEITEASQLNFVINLRGQKYKFKLK